MRQVVNSDFSLLFLVSNISHLFPIFGTFILIVVIHTCHIMSRGNKINNVKSAFIIIF